MDKEKPFINILETMATFSCTLSCKFCTNYSDYNMRGGYVRWSQMQDWLDVLFSRLSVGQLNIIGGEPFLNPELNVWIENLKKRYPYLRLGIVTNGTLLSKHMWIIDHMKKYGNMALLISNHQPHLTYVDDFKQEMLNRIEWNYEGFNGHSHNWASSKRLSFQISQNDGFLKTYRKNYGNMKPYNNDPVAAFEICTQQMCPLFVDGKLYKCSSIGLLHRVLSDHNQINDPDWKPYLGSGLGLDCSDEELRSYANNYGKPNPVCRMCPTIKDNAGHDHLSNVTSK